jgi:WD40 repeat protein
VPIGIQYEVGSAIEGGHPRVTGYSRWNITSLAMSADGLTLVSMGGVTLVWDVASDFSASRAIYVDYGSPEWPKVDISPDGRWIAISGDGRRVVSRTGLRPAGFATSFEAPDPCFPIELRFSPDGEWLAGAGWTGAIDVFRMADLDALAPSGFEDLDPISSIPANCGPGAPAVINVGTATRSAFTPDGRTLVTETGARYATADWQQLDGRVTDPALHGLRGGFEVSALGSTLVSDCTYYSDIDSHQCPPHAAPFPKFSPEGHWIVAGATLSHLSGDTRVLDASALVGIFAPNGDVIAAGADNSLTRYCKVE